VQFFVANVVQIIVEDEDGEVVKKYDIPSNAKPGKEGGEPSVARQGLNRMGTWTGLGQKPSNANAESSNAGASSSNTGNTSTTSAVRQGLSRMTTWTGKKPEDDEDDDRRIRFMIGEGGRRLTKEDFLNEIRTLDPKARCEIVEQSDADPAMKAAAKKDASNDSPGSSRLFEAMNTQAASGPRAAKAVGAEMARQRGVVIEEEDSSDSDDERAARRRAKTSQAPRQATKQSSPLKKSTSPSDDVEESAAERKRREQALKGVDDVTPAQRGRSRQVDDDEDSEVETAAEKRRREAALGVGGRGSPEDDSDDDDTPRVPPPVAKSRGIRFARSPVRGPK
jgi:hypothetical protein